MKRKKLPGTLEARGKLAVKVISAYTIMALTAAAQIVVFWLSTRMGFFPGEDVLMSIVSSFSEIIAGLYGITMAGYTFFLSRIDSLMAADGTLDLVAAGIKKRFKYLIWYITFNVLMTLFTSAVVMYVPAPEDGQIYFFYRLFCNEFVIFLSFSVGLILYYSVLVIDPNCVEKEAERMRKKLSREDGALGSVPEYVALYDRIQCHCEALIDETVLRQVYENKGRRFSYVLALLEEQRPEETERMQQLRQIHWYYECVVNSGKMKVTEEMCQMAASVLDALEGKTEEPLEAAEEEKKAE